ncbi:cyclin N-terminal domain-containing protein, partial [Favolaschia claudopus]
MILPSSNSNSSPSANVGRSTKGSNPVHAASLVDPAAHPPALLQLLNIKIEKHVIEKLLTFPHTDYVADCVSEAVDYALGRPWSPRSSHTSLYNADFAAFASVVLSCAEVTPGTLLVALSYIARARAHLTIFAEEWARECVFLGAVIVASKYTQDSTLRNVHWAACSGVFGARDIGRIEREFLEVLNWNLGVHEADLMAHHEGLSSACAKATRASRALQAGPPAYNMYLAPPPYTHRRRSSLPGLEALPSPQSSLPSLTPSPRTPSPYP